MLFQTTMTFFYFFGRNIKISTFLWFSHFMQISLKMINPFFTGGCVFSAEPS
jgi:hypothetical protein